MRSKANKLGKLIQISKVPIRILCKARDFYVKNMLSFAKSGKVGYGSVGGGATTLPKSFSVNYSLRDLDDEEYRQVLRLLSKKGSEMESFMGYANRQGDDRKSSSALRRCYSVGVGKIGRIDEDKACSFREDDDGNENFYSRSTSHAARRKVVYY